MDGSTANWRHVTSVTIRPQDPPCPLCVVSRTRAKVIGPPIVGLLSQVGGHRSPRVVETSICEINTPREYLDNRSLVDGRIVSSRTCYLG